MQLVDLESIPMFLTLTSTLFVKSYQASLSMHLSVNSYRAPLSTTRGKADGISPTIELEPHICMEGRF